MSEEANIKAIVEKKRKELQEKRKTSEQRPSSGTPGKPKVINPTFSMHKLWRTILKDDETYISLPMHDYDLGKDLLIHTHKNAQGKISHILCTEIFEEGSCEHCKKSGWEYEPRFVRAMVMYVFNSIGDKVMFNDKETGDPLIWNVNPAQVLEIQGDKKGGEIVLPLMNSLAKNKIFETTYWGIRREPGVPTIGKDGKERKVGGGFVQPETLSAEEVAERLGEDGFTVELPEYASKWSKMIKQVVKEQGKEKAKEEVFRYILSSFDNAKEIAELKGITLPTRDEVKQIEETVPF